MDRRIVAQLLDSMDSLSEDSTHKLESTMLGNATAGSSAASDSIGGVVETEGSRSEVEHVTTKNAHVVLIAITHK